MGTRWSVVLTAAGVLSIAFASVSCETVKSGGVATKIAEYKIRVDYNAKERSSKTDRIKVRKVKEDDGNGGPANTFNRCTDRSRCMPGHPVDIDGNAVLGAITVSDGNAEDLDQLFFVSDASSPGRTCVCYGNKCYCN